MQALGYDLFTGILVGYDALQIAVWHYHKVSIHFVSTRIVMECEPFCLHVWCY